MVRPATCARGHIYRISLIQDNKAHTQKHTNTMQREHVYIAIFSDRNMQTELAQVVRSICPRRRKVTTREETTESQEMGG